MTEINRYDKDNEGYMEYNSDGDYVRYEDYIHYMNEFHTTIKTVLGIKSYEPNDVEFYKQRIDNLMWSEAGARLDAEWDHLDLMSLVKYLKDQGKTLEEIKGIARNWQQKN